MNKKTRESIQRIEGEVYKRTGVSSTGFKLKK